MKNLPKKVIVLYLKINLIMYIKLISRTKHVEFCLKIGGPPSKSKYFLKFDSELVP